MSYGNSCVRNCYFVLESVQQPIKQMKIVQTVIIQLMTFYELLQKLVISTSLFR